jgi:hypothetical protein
MLKKHSSGPEEIKDEDRLLRRIPPIWIKDGGVSSAAFKQRPPLDLSVDIARLTTPEKVLLSHPGYGIGIITASFVLNLKLVIFHAPEPSNYAHAIVFGKITGSMAKIIARSAKLLRYEEVFSPILPQGQ